MSYKAKCPYCGKPYDRFTLLFIISSNFKCHSCSQKIKIDFTSYILVMLVPCVLSGIICILMISNIIPAIPAMLSITICLIAGILISPFFVKFKKGEAD